MILSTLVLLGSLAGFALLYRLVTIATRPPRTHNVSSADLAKVIRIQQARLRRELERAR